MNTELEHIWSRVLAELGRSVDDATFRIWIEPLRAVELEQGRLRVLAPPRTRDWIADRFGLLLQAGAATVVGPEIVLDLVAGDDAPALHPAAPARIGGAPRPTGGPAAGRVTSEPTALRRGSGDPALNPKLTFEQFVIGDSNRLAHAAALTVAEMPAQAYNPLFLYGPPGLGKTHLLHSIATYLMDHGGGLTVRYTTGEAFTNEFLSALGDGSLDRFKARFRRVDVLLIDDIQFLERKVRTEEEFFHTFNALLDMGSQLVLTCDRLPRDLQALEDRLRERFEAGLVADIRSPDQPTRMAILRKRAHHDGIELQDDRTLLAIAERVELNVRALEGALIRVVAFSSLTGRPLTADLATEVLDGLYPRRRREQRSIAEIQSAVCEQFQVSAEELLSKDRAARVAWPRQIAMYAVRELTGESLPAIGRHFGNRDHTTVMHALKRTSERIGHDAAARQAVDSLLARLRQPGA